MDNSFSFANTAMRLQQSGTGTYFTIPSESPLRVAPRNHIPLKHVSMLEHLVTGGIHVRVHTGIQYKAAKANGTSLGRLHELHRNADVIEHDDVWLEPS